MADADFEVFPLSMGLALDGLPLQPPEFSLALTTLTLSHSLALPPPPPPQPPAQGEEPLAPRFAISKATARSTSVAAQPVNDDDDDNGGAAGAQLDLPHYMDDADDATELMRRLGGVNMLVTDPHARAASNARTVHATVAHVFVKDVNGAQWTVAITYMRGSNTGSQLQLFGSVRGQQDFGSFRAFQPNNTLGASMRKWRAQHDKALRRRAAPGPTRAANKRRRVAADYDDSDTDSQSSTDVAMV